MKNKIIVLVIVFVLILFSSSVYGDLTDDLIIYYKMDNDTVSTVVEDSEGNYNATLLGATEGHSGIIIDSVKYDGSGDESEITDTALDTSKAFTISMWINDYDDDGDREWIFGDGELGTGSTGISFVLMGDINAFYITHSDGSGANSWECEINNADFFTNMTQAGWHHVIIGSNTSNCYATVDNQTLVTAVMEDPILDGPGNLVFGQRPVNADYDMDIYLDEIGIWNRTLSLSEISDLWNEGAGLSRDDIGGGAPPAASGDSLNISTTYPTNNTQYNTVLLNINTTVNSTENFDCRLYLNDTLNQTIEDYTNNNDEPVDFNLSFSASDTFSYTYFFSCNNSQNETNTTALLFYIDNVDPLISENVNMSSVFGYDSLPLNLTFSDTYLYSYNVSWCGTEDYNDSLNGDSSVLYDNLIDITNCSNGTNTLTVNITDGHTAKTISEYDNEIDTKEKGLKYNFGNDWIKIKPVEYKDYDDPYTIKKKDRYEFIFNKNVNPNISEEFIVQSSKDIDIMPRTDYRGWLIIPSLNKWIDFEFEELGFVDIERLESNKILIRVWGLTSKTMHFNSIGDLNTIQETYTFYKYNVTSNYLDPLITTQTAHYNLTITYDDTYINYTSANFTFNGTEYEATKTSYTGYDFFNYSTVLPSSTVAYNITHNWKWTIEGYDFNDTNSTSSTITEVTPLGIDNCSTYTTTAMTYFLRNETDNTLVSGDADGYFTVWIDNPSNAVNYNLSWTGANNHSVCINPAYASYFINAQIEYTATGFDTNTYYFDNTSISNSSNNYTFYLADSATADQVTFTVKDQNDNDVEDVYIHILTYDLTTNTSTTGQIIKTGSTGRAFANLVLNTQRYVFILYYNGEIVLQTSDVILTSTTQTFRINTISDYFESYDVVNGVSCDITFDNETDTFSFVFSDPSSSITQACLSIVQEGLAGTSAINNSCLSTTSGTIDIVLSDTGTNTYFGEGIIYLNSNTFLCGNTTSYSYNRPWDTFGSSGILMTFLLILPLVLIGVWHPIISVFLLLFGVIMSIILGIFYISWSMLMALIIIGIITIYRLNRR